MLGSTKNFMSTGITFIIIYVLVVPWWTLELASFHTDSAIHWSPLPVLAVQSSPWSMSCLVQKGIPLYTTQWNKRLNSTPNVISLPQYVHWNWPTTHAYFAKLSQVHQPSPAQVIGLNWMFLQVAFGVTPLKNRILELVHLILVYPLTINQQWLLVIGNMKHQKTCLWTKS